MNRAFLSFLATSRTRSSALGALCRRCVRDAFCSIGFPLARPLPSTASAAGCPALFGCFPGTMGLSDFLRSFIVGVRPQASRHDPRHHQPRVSTGSPGSRAKCFRTCSGSLTAQSPNMSRDIDMPGVAFRFS